MADERPNMEAINRFTRIVDRLRYRPVASTLLAYGRDYDSANFMRQWWVLLYRTPHGRYFEVQCHRIGKEDCCGLTVQTEDEAYNRYEQLQEFTSAWHLPVEEAFPAVIIADA